jgi:hypothetical protein
LLRARGRRGGRGAWRGMAWRAQSVCPVERRMQSVCPVERRMQSVCPVERRMQSVCPVEGACNRCALWRAHGGDVTHEGIWGAVTPLCVATSRANCTEYWAPSPVCRVKEGRARGCMGGCADGALWARIALCGWRGSASFGHPPRQAGVGGPEIVIDRRAEPSRSMCVEGDDSDVRVACWRGRPRIAVSASAGPFLKSGRLGRRTGATIVTLSSLCCASL